MNALIKLANITISIHIHPSEILEKVMQVFSHILPMNLDEIKEKITLTKVTGDYGNNITILTYKIKNNKEMKYFLQILNEKLPLFHKQYLYHHFQPGKTFFLRLHKQLLSNGLFRISQYDDVVHVSLRFSRFQKDENEKTNIQHYLLNNGVIAQ